MFFTTSTCASLAARLLLLDPVLNGLTSSLAHDSTVIKDAYPKSSYHYLLLPRSPFPLPSSLPGAPSSLTTAELSSLQRFLTLPKETVLHVLDLMEETLAEVVTSLEDTMRKERGWEGVVDVQMGFHAVPSMRCESFSA